MLPPGDILIHCGDFANKGNKQDVQYFIQWMSGLSQYPEKYVIDGNHDRTLKKNASAKDNIDLQQMFERSDSVYLLQDEFIETKHGILIYGASWNTCESGSFPHRFHLQPDIFLAHSPPYLSRSITIPQVGEDKSNGWKMNRELADVVLSNKIPLCLGGHVHWTRGVVEVKHYTRQNGREWTNDSIATKEGGAREDKSVFVNASSLQSQRSDPYMAPPIVIDFDVFRRMPIRIKY
ncbi:hypothetical protein CTEN210_04207 [Chaetoceros tenuissimus]|uniref:Calcineurin-like phosphoesterase domain-containing protein n=1 Tax=Chaetoceros tenuissimus TaxID=426638 RepID=A0AAD3H225_9STRA|nr:hypothetical protein CTEN210_04207 [Chaetoceros tenuissimus]